VNVPILGLIENMSYYVCTHCGHREEIFDNGGGRRAAEELGIPFLGEIPIFTSIRVSGDTGKPVVLEERTGGPGESIRRIARNMAAQVSIRNASRAEDSGVDIQLT
jgi:ATP-binding protein involved in chromosome partitioning